MLKKTSFILSITILLLLLNTKVSSVSIFDVGVEVGDSFIYLINHTYYSLEQNGVSYTENVANNYAGKNATITVDSLNEVTVQNYLGESEKKVQINSSISIANVHYSHSTYLNQWYENLKKLYSLHSQFFNFNPGNFSFEVYNVTNEMAKNFFLEFPVYATTDFNYYNALMDDELDLQTESYSKKWNFYNCSYDTVLNFGGADVNWTMTTFFSYYIYIDIKAGLVYDLSFSYGFDFEQNTSQLLYNIGYSISRISNTQEVNLTPFSINFALVSFGVIVLLKQNLRRRK